MNVYRRMTMAVMACAAGLSATACTAGITTASRVASPSSATSRTASSPTASDSHSPSPSPSPAAVVRVKAPIGSFPIPEGAQVRFNISCPKQIGLALTPVTPSHAEAFYSTALPKAGYKITQNMPFYLSTGDPKGIAAIGFTGHGYTGEIIDAADLSSDASAAPSLGNINGTLTKNVLEIMMYKTGVPDSYICPD